MLNRWAEAIFRQFPVRILSTRFLVPFLHFPAHIFGYSFVSTCHKDIAYFFVVRFISFRLDALQSSSCHITCAFFEECFFMSCSCFQRAGRGSLKFIRCASRPPLLLLLLLHLLVLQLLNRKLQTERARPDFNCEGHISMGIVGPQPQTQDLSGHCRTSTASCRQSGPGRISTAKAFQWALSDLNHGHRISVGSSQSIGHRCHPCCINDSAVSSWVD